jgi:hypothetical protein
MKKQTTPNGGDEQPTTEQPTVEQPTTDQPITEESPEPTTAGSGPTAPTAPTPPMSLSARPAPAEPDHRVRTSTVVWGLVVIAVGLGLFAVALGVTFDVGLAAIGLVAAAGALLLVGAVITASRSRR